MGGWDGSDGVAWFVVLPDTAAAAPVAAAVRDRAARRISHPSGRPWLLGSWPGDAVTTGRAGQAKIALVGEHATTADRLEAAAARISAVADLDRFAETLTGSSHLVATVAGRVRVQGTVLGLRGICHARIGEVTVAADRADVLAGLLGGQLDERQLAVHLLSSSVLHPLAGQPVWRGVHAVPVGHYLVLDGGHRTVRWWTPPHPAVPMAEGARALREALSDAVAARVASRDLVSCDLGGLDSTSICSLAARGPATVVAYTADGRDPMADDVTWARRTVAGLGNVEHHEIPGDRVPMVYDGVGDIDDRFDEPCPAAVHLGRWLAIARPAAARGSRMHLTGFGGDELLAGSPAHLHALLRTHPRTALRNARGFATQRPWHHGETLRQLSGSRPYRWWLSRAGDRLTDPAPPPETPTLDWGVPPRLPPWATPDAVGAVRELIRTAARDAEPLAAARGQHVELQAMHSTARLVRQLGQVTARLGLTMAAPYYDDRVVEAGLAVRPQDRVTPWRYKPLIVEAMRGVVPEQSLTRHTKDEGSYEVEVGLTHNRAALLQLCEQSRLARLGLIDPDALRAVCSRPLPASLQFDALYQTVACEVWLRTQDSTRDSTLDTAADTLTVPS